MVRNKFINDLAIMSRVFDDVGLYNVFYCRYLTFQFIEEVSSFCYRGFYYLCCPGPFRSTPWILLFLLSGAFQSYTVDFITFVVRGLSELT